MKNSTDTINKDVPYLLDIVVLKNSNQKSDVLKINSTNYESEFSYMPSLLNQTQSVEIEVYLSDITNAQLDISGNLIDGNIKMIESNGVTERKPLSNLFDNLIYVLGAKWLAILIFTILFLLSVLKSIAAVSEGVDEPLEYIFAFLFFTIDILFLLILIGLISR